MFPNIRVLCANIIIILYLLSLCEIGPCSNLAEILANTLQASLAKSRSRTSTGDTGIKANASLSSLIGAAPTCNAPISVKPFHKTSNNQTEIYSVTLTFDITGFSSSLSIGIDVLWTQESVHKWCSRTYDDCGTRESPLVNVVGSSSNNVAISFGWGTETRW